MHIEKIGSRIRSPYRSLDCFLLAVALALSGSSTKSIFGQGLPLRLEQPEQQLIALRVEFGHGAAVRDSWRGRISLEGAIRLQVAGWQLAEDDRVDDASFEITTFRGEEQPPMVKGLFLQGETPPHQPALLRLQTNQGNLEMDISELSIGEARLFLGGSGLVRRQLPSEELTTSFRDDDYPAMLVGDDIWIVWQSYDGEKEDIRLRKRVSAGWQATVRVPGVRGDVWRPQLGRDAHGRIWVVWSEQIAGNFDLYGRFLEADEASWGPRVRLTTHPLPDIEHHLRQDAKGRLWLVWQGFRDDNSDIFLRFYDGDAWSDEYRISDDPANDWQPRVAVSEEGVAYVVWDSYRSGSYDVYLRTFAGTQTGKIEPIATTNLFEAHASVEVDREGRVWIAWDEGGIHWGKDTGPTAGTGWLAGIRETWQQWVDSPSVPNTRLYESRQIRLLVMDGARRRQTGQDLQEALGQAGIFDEDSPRLFCDPATGRVALFFRSWGDRGSSSSFGSRSVYWEQSLAILSGGAAARILTLPQSRGRPSMLATGGWGVDGDLWMAWPADGRELHWREQNLVGTVRVAHVRVTGPTSSPLLTAWKPPPVPERPSPHPHEREDIAEIRAYRTIVDGTENRIVRGDLHRHSEFSWDSNGGFIDGSLFDFYRYVLDAADLDFGALTDHNGGKAYKYWWWLNQKACDMFYLPGVFVPFYAYERSLDYPLGHRNILYTRRGQPVIPYSILPDYPGPVPRIAAGVADVTKDDTRLLFESLHALDGISIPHTTGSDMGTDWADYDPAVEPVVEMFQGDRISYEYPGAPRSVGGREDHPRGGYQEEGFVWNAYRKGRRLGTIASSDHWSTHISYAMVFTRANTRKDIFEALKKRHTYGATDNIILDYRMGDAFMGDERETSDIPTLEIKAIGTARISRIDIIQDEEIVYTASPGRPRVHLSYLDQAPLSGSHYYYVRLLQEDGQMAWGSPIWIDYRREQE